MRKPFIILSFGFLKCFENFDIFDLRPKNIMCLFCKCSVFSQLSLEIPSTHLTMQCHKCLLHMENHMNLLGSVIGVDRISR